MNHRSETYLAARARDTIAMYVFKNHTCIRSYSLNSTAFPSRSSITAIMFVKPEKFNDKLIPDDNDSIYLLIGFYAGYVYLVRALKKEVKILKKYNKQSDAESGFFSKTFSYLSGSGSSEYTVWQSSTVVKMKMTRKSSPSFLFRNGVLSIMDGVDSSMEDVQKKFDWMVSQVSQISKNTMVAAGKYIYSVCNEYKLMRDGEKCVIGFNNTVSSYEISESSLFVGTFNGMLFEFEMEAYHCIRKIETVIAIKHLSLISNILALCLQDDYTQLIDLSTNRYVNLTGHNSFTGCVIDMKSSILLGSYDGSISITNPRNIKLWKELGVKNKVQTSFSLEVN